MDRGRTFERAASIASSRAPTVVVSQSSSVSSFPTRHSAPEASTSGTRIATGAQTTPQPLHSTSVECVVCCDSFNDEETVEAPCPDGHRYCSGCIRDFFAKATRDESVFPPTCDGYEIPMDDCVRKCLSYDQWMAYKSKAIEFTTMNRLYCSATSCARFLGESTETPERVVCSECQSATCRACRAPWHDSIGACAQGTDVEVVTALKSELGYQTCPSCRRLVELQVGCYHMYVGGSEDGFDAELNVAYDLVRICHCRKEFCYVCSATWKQCACPYGDEDMLYAADDRGARLRRAEATPQDRVQELHDLREALAANTLCTHHDHYYAAGRGRCYRCDTRYKKFLLVSAVPAAEQTIPPADMFFCQKRCRRCRVLVCVPCQRNGDNDGSDSN